ncbi:MAG TPA: hypothetical protein VHA73_09085 [Acidimicrobiales bacterium]|nr:hypothetical protein [Acidimicrobiales bacterium]
MTGLAEIPVAHTPPGGYGDTMPPPVLGASDEPLVDGAPDLRGTWKVVDASAPDGGALAADHPIWHHVERIEQAGNRLVVTGGGVVHDMVVDGVVEHGVNDVMAADFSTEIHVAATFEGGALVLRPEGLPGVTVRRWRDGPRLRWSYHVLFEAVLERIE